MGFFHDYPYTDFHEINLDWILREIRKLHKDYDEFQALNTITFDGAWDITKQYQAWTIVNVNGTTGYISVQPVPAGIDYTNTDYWRLIADYTVTMADLQNRVVALENKDVTIETELTRVGKIADRLNNRKFIFVYDSYGGSLNNTMSNAVRQILGLTEGVDCQTFIYPGYGFIGISGRYLTAVSDPDTGFESVTIPHDQITDVYVIGGSNDITFTSNQLDQPIKDFYDYAKSIFPNAKMHCGFDGYTSDASIRYEYAYTIYRYKEICSSYGISFMYNLEYTLCDYWMQADTIHPTNVGLLFLARRVCDCILHDDVCSNTFFDTQTVTIDTTYIDLTSPNTLYLRTKKVNENTFVEITPIALRHTNTITEDIPFAIGTVTSATLYPQEAFKVYLPMIALVGSGGTYSPVNVKVYIQNNTLYLECMENIAPGFLTLNGIYTMIPSKPQIAQAPQ